jgi:hypothetical protein
MVIKTGGDLGELPRPLALRFGGVGKASNIAKGHLKLRSKVGFKHKRVL